MFTGSLSTLLPREVAERGGIWARSAIQRILWAICAFVCVLLLLIPIASEILVIVFGDQYRNQGLVFVFIAAGSVIYAGIVPINSILQALERQKVVAINAIFRAVTLLSFISVGAFAAGAFGASVAYFSVMVTELFIVSMRLLSKRGRVSIFREGRV
jgi:O-antigen/teichoic acid export membrane protein